MSLERPFRISMLVLVLSGMAALSLALGSLVWLAGGFATFVAIVVWAAARPNWHLSRGVATVVVVLIAQGVVIECLTTGTVLVPAAHFLLATQLVWLTQERNNRHYGWLCVMSLLQLMLAGVLSVDLLFGLCFLVYLPAGVCALLLYNLRCELERQGELTPSRTPRVGLRLVAGVAVVTVAEVVLSTAVFMYFPRIAIQVLQLKPLQRGSRLSGFSDRVRFGELARVLDNPEVVMSVRLTQGGKPVRADAFPLLMRGIALDTYRHATWTTQRYIPDSDERSLPFPLRESREMPDRDVVQDIVLEPVNTRLLFYLNAPPQRLHHYIRLRADTPNLERIRYHRESGAISSVHGSFNSLHYIVRSRLPRWRMDVLRRPIADSERERILQSGSRYLQLPDTIGKRTRELAAEIVADIPPGHFHDRAKRVELYLKSEYDYTTEAGLHSPGVDPVDDFLFTKKKGHCEYFASAMALMLRTLGIEARIVTGFSGGEWNEYGQFYIIRQRNAHAWVEVHNPELDDWVTYDPTPAATTTTTAGGHGWLGGLSDRLAYMRLWWNNNVVNFSSGDQRRLAKAVTHALSRLPNYLPLWGRDRLSLDSGLAAGVGAAIVFGVLVAIVGVYFGVAYLLGRKFHWGCLRRRRRTGVPSVGFYRRMLDVLRRRGYRREPSTTPREFAQEVVAQGGAEPEPVGVVTEAFCRVRYGGERLTADDRSAVSRALADLEGKKR